MVKRSTWVMVVLMAVLAGLAYYLQQPDNLIKKAAASGATPTIEPLGTLLTVPAGGTLDSISVQSADGHSVILKHEAAGWTLSIDTQNPIPADQSAAEQVASQAQELRLITKIEAKTPDLSAFGLDKPADICSITLSDGKSVTFKIGKPTLTGDGYYLQKEDGSLVVIDKGGMDTLLNLLTQPPYMFTPTPSSLPATETPTATTTLTPVPVTQVPTGTTLTESVTKLTPTKQP
jgi:hypothetical protein